MYIIGHKSWVEHQLPSSSATNTATPAGGFQIDIEVRGLFYIPETTLLVIAYNPAGLL